ncbi:hypothetical protein Gotri_001576 [Gossypium trilobum]|uniref:MADS-box domain-containing protein n=2 Tax=Gossypium TaxID=3633 RepID=A0A7J9FF84_9ROSI|nr:hypothetical protein [Gossypium davidsonii]MBA0783940.1 hypothetical protein [Gossypium trilobum]
MSRKKIKLAYITNDSARKTTYKKRSKGLVKKVRELIPFVGLKLLLLSTPLISALKRRYGRPSRMPDACCPSSSSCPFRNKTIRC